MISVAAAGLLAASLNLIPTLFMLPFAMFESTKSDAR
jgi:hypothetical protein